MLSPGATVNAFVADSFRDPVAPCRRHTIWWSKKPKHAKRLAPPAFGTGGTHSDPGNRFFTRPVYQVGMGRTIDQGPNPAGFAAAGLDRSRRGRASR